MSAQAYDLVVLGLSLSSSWGNGHATTYRALLNAYAEQGHRVLFLERNTAWYAAHRDLPKPPFCEFALYDDQTGLAHWADKVGAARAVMVGSYVPDGARVGDWAMRTARGVTAFYDIDTPVTLARLARGEDDYLRADQIARYDLYLSFTGGPTLALLEKEYGSPAARALYCSVDAKTYRPLDEPLRWDLSYLGTYSPDRQPTLQRMLLEPARRAPHLRFAVAGPQYPADIDWPANVERIEHVPPVDHPQFYAASRFTLNVTRQDMIAAGFSPSVRLFEAAACATPIISDRWAGIETLLKPGRDMVLADDAEDVLAAIAMPEQQRSSLGRCGRAAVLAGHTAQHRARELEGHLQAAAGRPKARSFYDPIHLSAEVQ